VGPSRAHRRLRRRGSGSCAGSAEPRGWEVWPQGSLAPGSQGRSIPDPSQAVQFSAVMGASLCRPCSLAYPMGVPPLMSQGGLWGAPGGTSARGGVPGVLPGLSLPGIGALRPHSPATHPHLHQQQQVPGWQGVSEAAMLQAAAGAAGNLPLPGGGLAGAGVGVGFPLGARARGE